MKKLFSILLAGAISLSGLNAFANPTIDDADINKDLNAVKIFRVNNPSEGLMYNNKNANLCIKYARGERMPQYLIMLDESIKKEGDCITASFLVNLKSRLAFIEGKLYNDSVLVIKTADKEEQLDIKTIDSNGEGDYSPALFSFRIIEGSEDQSFLIESWAKNIGSAEGEWVKISNGIPVAVNTTLKEAKTGKADIFNLGQVPKTKGNEGVTQDIEGSNISLNAGYGSLNIQGATGKKVVVTNSLGQVIATETANSNNISINVPSGIAFVAIDGQPTMKALVK